MIHFDKGEQTSVEGFIVMDDGDYEEKDLVRVCSPSNVYECVTHIQAHYLKTGEWIKE